MAQSIGGLTDSFSDYKKLGIILEKNKPAASQLNKTFKLKVLGKLEQKRSQGHLFHFQPGLFRLAGWPAWPRVT